MKIDFFRMLENNVRRSEQAENFINELANYLEENNNEKILDKVKEENKVTLISENRIIREEYEIRKKYIGMSISHPQYKEQIQERIKQEIIKMSKKVLKEQNKKLVEYRKEGHLYMVEEDVKGRIYLLDLSKKNGVVFEEVDFPQKLIHKATEGAVFKYKKGTYTFYSHDGLERLYE